MDTREEKDALGPVEVPADAYYGAFTARAQDNFAVTGETAPDALYVAFGQVKEAAARANRELGVLDGDVADAVIEAAGEVQEGRFADDFVLDPIQAGAGTPFHMNANEIIANRATELLGGDLGDYRVDPHDHVNRGQSSNNVVPTAVRLAALAMLDDLDAELDALAAALRDTADDHKDVVKVGRTHLQDAVPVTVGQEFDAWAQHVEDGRQRIADAADELHTVGLGGTAVGTGITAHPEFRETAVDALSDIAGRDLKPPADGVALTQSMAPFSAVSGALRSLCGDLINACDDLMLLSSGPVAGLAELQLPAVEEGSSIMPGKVNPSIVEAAKMACIQATGNDAAISTAAQEGDLDMHVMAPVIARNLFDTLRVLTNAARMLRERCIDGLTVDRDRIRTLFDGSTATATALSPYLGYDRTAEVVQAALDHACSIRDEVLDRGLLTADELDTVLDPDRLTGPAAVDEELQDRVQDRLDD